MVIFTKEDLEESLSIIVSMINRSEKAKENIIQGTSQYTLLRNRIKALNIASFLISKELEGNVIDYCNQEDLEESLAPIISLISKSEKAQKKLSQDTWQYKMLSNNLKALNISLSLLKEILNEK